MSRAKYKAEESVMYLFIVLFFISLVKSFELLTLTAIGVIIYSIKNSRDKNIFKHVKPVLPFIILMLLPKALQFLLTGHVTDLDFNLMIVYKIALSSILLSTVASKYSNLYLVEGILAIGLPSIFNRILALTFRYFHMVNEDVKKSNDALKSRGLMERTGFSNLSIFGELIGGFFLKSINHSEMVFSAMQSRGFEGDKKEGMSLNKNLFIKSTILSASLIIILLIDRKIRYGN